jgi:hypothetical protein
MRRQTRKPGKNVTTHKLILKLMYRLRAIRKAAVMDVSRSKETNR